MFEINITQLRKEGRPLWMTEFGHEADGELLSAGGDIWLDRLHPEWERDFGRE